MRLLRFVPAGASMLLLFASIALAGQAPSPQTPAPTARGNPAETEVWEPVPAAITPGATDGQAPSDAIVLFDGRNLDEWVSARDDSPARWIVADVRLAPGNSGGPLVDVDGRLVGINSMVVNGLGVAVPSDLVRDFVERALAQRAA